MMMMTFPSYRFDEPTLAASSCNAVSSDEIEEVRCEWLRASEVLRGFLDTGEVNSEIEPALLGFSKAAQKVMSSTASNYDVSRLYIGLLVGGIAVCLSAWPTYRLLLKWQFPGAYFMSSILGYGAMMFASSYVEEEQQFWYWVFTGWTFYLHARSCGRHYSNTLFKPGLNVSNMGAIGLAVFHRVLRRWNQTGQKYAGEPDIARNFLPFHISTLWLLVVLTYLVSCGQISFCLPRGLIWRLIAIVVTLVTFLFKLAFVASESPELLNNPSVLKLMKSLVDIMPLIFQARLTFVAISLLTVLSVSAKRDKGAWLRIQMRGKYLDVGSNLLLFFFFFFFFRLTIHEQAHQLPFFMRP